MKILLLNYEYPPLGGGGGVACKVLAEAWVGLGHSVTILTSSFQSLPRENLEDGVWIIRARILGRTGKSTASPLSMLSYLPAGFIQYLIKKIKFDVINTHFTLPTGPLGIAIAKLSGKPNILSIHGADIHDPSRFSPDDHAVTRWLNTLILNSADRVIAQSSNTIENANKYYNFNTSTAVIPLAYAPFKFRSTTRKELGWDDHKKYLIGIGRLVRRKGFDDLIRSLKTQDPEVELVIVGEGPESDRLKNQALELGLSNRVHFPGFVSHERKFQYLQNSDLYVLSSLHEGFGIVLQEAMQVGLPIVATNNGGQVDLIEDGVNGFLVPPQDIRCLGDKIKQVLGSPELALKMSESNLRQVEQYEAGTIARQYLDIFNDSIKQTSSNHNRDS